MSNKIILKAEEIDGFLTDTDRINLKNLENIYAETMSYYKNLNPSQQSPHITAPFGKSEEKIISLYEEMGELMRDITSKEKAIQVYPFEMPQDRHGEASRLISKLRSTQTANAEFVYYIQRAYELLFDQMYNSHNKTEKNNFIVKTPVTYPVQNYAVHKLFNADKKLQNTVMCVMLRGALLPSMILSKEIQEFSSTNYITPFALFRIQRNDSKNEKDMEYILDLDKSFFKPEDLEGKDLIFADPMNATGGSLATTVKYILDQGIKPASIKVVNVIAACKGALTIARSIENVTLHTLWMDPYLNEKAYILPGLGDAGDRINGEDTEDVPRNMIQLLGDYGSNILSLYRSQVRCIEQTILER